MSNTVSFDTIRRKANDTEDAYCVCHPDNPLKVIHLPKSETEISQSTLKGRCLVEIPRWLAREHDIT